MKFDYKRMIKFEHNLCEKEKKYRLIGGAVAIVISVFFAEITLLLIGLYVTATGYFGWCPVYSGLNKSSACPAAESTTEEAS